MNLTKLSLALSCCVAISMLGGCAATVKSSGTDTLAIREAAKRNIILELQGNTRVEQNKDWPRLKEEWSQALHVEATQAGYGLAEPQPMNPVEKDGIGLKINVTNFRYLTPGARYSAGVMVGNAWINSSADFTDLKSGQLIGSRTYDTSSSAWEGVMSAMTEEQVQAIARQIISDIKRAKAQ